MSIGHRYKQYLKALANTDLASGAYPAQRETSKEASKRARAAEAGEPTELERNLAHPYMQGLPTWLVPWVRRWAGSMPSMNETRAWQLNLLLQTLHMAARKRFGTKVERLAHLHHSLSDEPRASVTVFADSSILVRYSERLFNFVEFFCDAGSGRFLQPQRH